MCCMFLCSLFAELQGKRPNITQVRLRFLARPRQINLMFYTHPCDGKKSLLSLLLLQVRSCYALADISSPSGYVFINIIKKGAISSSFAVYWNNVQCPDRLGYIIHTIIRKSAWLPSSHSSVQEACQEAWSRPNAQSQQRYTQHIYFVDKTKFPIHAHAVTWSCWKRASLRT